MIVPIVEAHHVRPKFNFLKFILPENEGVAGRHGFPLYK